MILCVSGVARLVSNISYQPAARVFIGSVMTVQRNVRAAVISRAGLAGRRFGCPRLAKRHWAAVYDVAPTSRTALALHLFILLKDLLLPLLSPSVRQTPTNWDFMLGPWVGPQLSAMCMNSKPMNDDMVYVLWCIVHLASFLMSASKLPVWWLVEWTPLPYRLIVLNWFHSLSRPNCWRYCQRILEALEVCSVCRLQDRFVFVYSHLSTYFYFFIYITFHFTSSYF